MKLKYNKAQIYLNSHLYLHFMDKVIIFITQIKISKEINFYKKVNRISKTLIQIILLN